MSTPKPNTRKRSETIVSRLLETYLPDERQKVSKKRAKKSTANRNNRKILRTRHEAIKEILDPKKQKEKLKQTRKRNIETLTSWETEGEINSIKEKILQMKTEKERLIQKSSSGLYESSKSDYFEKPRATSTTTRSWPGLTPGLAPVDYESDSESD